MPGSGLLQQMLQDNPRGVWPLQEGSGSTGFDATGNGRHATNSGTVVWGSPTDLMQGIALNGAFHLQIADPFSVFSAESFTVEAWFRTTINGYTSIFAKYNALANNTKWNIRLNNLNKIVGYMDSFSGGMVLPASATTLNDNKWHQAVFSYNILNNAITLYTDGALSATGSGTSDTYARSAGTQAVTIGAYDSGGLERFTGRVAYCGYWPGLLSATRIKAHYEAGIRGGVVLG